MSLLIKALNKAEEAQAKNTRTEQAQTETSKKNEVNGNKFELELEIEAGASSKLHSKTSQSLVKNNEAGLSLSPGSEISETVTKPAGVLVTPINNPTVIPSSTQQSSSQHMAAKNAANVFTSKGLEVKKESTQLAIIAGASLIILLGIGLYFYQFVDKSPPILLPPRPLEPNATTLSAAISPIVIPTENAHPETSKTEAATLDPTILTKEPITPSASESADIKPLSRKTNQSALVQDESLFEEEDSSDEDNSVKVAALSDDRQVGDDSNNFQSSFSANNASKKTRKSKSNASITSAHIASESASISVTKSTPLPGVNPALMSAYDAYNAGRDTEAQKLYKQVLKNDISNVDALLGLGAIASRQGRIADANGWYGKVLEVDPRNSIAKTAILNSNLMSNQAQGNELNNETNLKNMLAKQPDDANLHVALGNFYAEQNQWPEAQQAYFEAYSLNKTTDNAYNLAVSLDQMGKPKLALPYYIQALEQATDASNIDKIALQARISAIQ